MSDQASTTIESPEAAPVAASQPDAPAPVAASVDPGEVAALRKEIEKLRKESADRRVKAKDEEAAKLRALEEQGQYKALAEERAKQIAELEALKSAGERWRAHEERETKRIAQARESLASHWQAALDAAPTLEAKQAVLSAYEAERAANALATGKGPPPSKAAPVAAAPAPTPPPADVRSMSIDALRAGLRDDKSKAGILASLGVKPRQSRLDPFGRPT